MPDCNSRGLGLAAAPVPSTAQHGARDHQECRGRDCLERSSEDLGTGMHGGESRAGQQEMVGEKSWPSGSLSIRGSLLGC